MAFPVALQLFSVRDDMEKDFYGTLKAVKEMGYDGVEFAGFFGEEAGQIRAWLDELGLKAVSSHVAYDLLLEDVDGQIAFHKALGCQYIAIPFLDEKRRPGSPEFPQVIERIKELGKAIRDGGLQLLYHNHNFEFVKLGEVYGLDYLYTEVGPELLQTELDTCWVNVAGENPAAYVEKYAGRAPVVHLKDFTGDITKGIIPFGGKDPAGFNFAPVGFGKQDMPSILEASRKAGTRWVVVEQDMSTERTPMEAAKMSRDYLKSIGN